MKSVKEYLAGFIGKQREAEIILAHILKTDRANIIAHPERQLTFFQSLKLSRAKRALKNNVPLAYILGQKEFFGLNFFVNKNVLMPRPETELVVSLALDKSKQITVNGKQITIIDIGTGSGCIAVSIAKNEPKAKIFALDISRPALRVAQKNAKQHQVNIQFLHGDLLEPLINSKFKIQNYLIITANLPYLTREWTESEPSIAHEPKLALIADDKNGLSLYEKLLKQINALNATGQPILILCEIDPRQTTGAINLAKKYFPNAQIEIKKDLAGRDRVLKIELV